MTGAVSILVADDDTDIRDLVTFKLTQSGYQVRAVPDGETAWAELQRQPPDVAVLDVMMPGLTGIDVLRRVREDDRTKDIPVILLTARSRDVDREEGYANGASDYLVKPFSPRELVQRVVAVLTR
ncbi:Phosphate regulon transcriptional regulatory protein PhoB [Austwickia sp. TVS 96-490-7B]|uniref:response regulator transcription factor n=1 Tax=Austwickia sp. TVS 96-490-7B TaxID=2830843 RepID=UPI001C58AE9A|nr:response regulator [Austwickia sp. TVS 96-490-7B]MBW3084607.1 Phosphate regulon transcriptional regulatory protein PhoB [Austwickia sp. TVS 96-490-7B]